MIPVYVFLFNIATSFFDEKNNIFFIFRNKLNLWPKIKYWYFKLLKICEMKFL